MNNRFVALYIFLQCVFLPAVFGQGDNIGKDKLLERIYACSDYACDVLIDETGQSRCDYNIFDNKWTPYETPWHTGQLINALLESYKVTGRAKYLEKAVFCGNWWISLEIKDDSPLKGMVKGIHGDHMDDNLIVFATISDGTPGLYNLSRVTNNPVYAQVVTRAAKWMLENMYDARLGVCYDNVDMRTGKVIKKAQDFAGKLYYFYRPNTEGFLFKDAYDFSGDDTFRKAYLTLCDSLISFQTKEGLWMQFKPNDIGKGVFHPRYNLWNAESLLEAYDMTLDSKYLEAAAKTARFYIKYQDNSGAMFYNAKLDGSIDRSTICSSEAAFAGLIWMRLVGYGYPEFKQYYERSALWLMNASFSVEHEDPNLRGAVVEIKTSISKGKTKIVNRDIGTTFALRFLTSYYKLLYTR